MSAGPPERTVVVYSRPGCHLCETAIAALEALRAEGHRFLIEEVDIEADERLLRTYLARIPVVEVDGSVVCELILDEAALRASLDTVGSNGADPRGA